MGRAKIVPDAAAKSPGGSHLDYNPLDLIKTDRSGFGDTAVSLTAGEENGFEAGLRRS